jgi:hypothetical protein
MLFNILEVLPKGIEWPGLRRHLNNADHLCRSGYSPTGAEQDLQFLLAKHPMRGEVGRRSMHRAVSAVCIYYPEHLRVDHIGGIGLLRKRRSVV